MGGILGWGGARLVTERSDADGDEHGAIIALVLVELSDLICHLLLLPIALRLLQLDDRRLDCSLLHGKRREGGSTTGAPRAAPPPASAAHGGLRERRVRPAGTGTRLLRLWLDPRWTGYSKAVSRDSRDDSVLISRGKSAITLSTGRVWCGCPVRPSRGRRRGVTVENGLLRDQRSVAY